MDFYLLKINTPAGKEISMKDFKGKVVLIVNTATQCGFTSQIDGLEKLHNAYKDQGLVVIGTPCNQFGSQEPLENSEMIEKCRINHGVTFQLTEKIEVKGSGSHPLYKYLNEECGSFLDNLFSNEIKWNFTKFLIDRNGKPLKRYSPLTKPSKIEADIKRLLSFIP